MANLSVEKVFCASPGDLEEERRAFRGCIDEYNRLSGDDSGIRFEPVMWEYDTYSAIGHDPQSVISEQIGTKYQLFVGLMWARFGTVTPRASSGTEEELYAAVKRWKETAGGVGIMFFFKDAPVYVSELDPVQIYRVIKFKEVLGGQGIFYHHFGGKDGRRFEDVFRQSLTLYARHRAKVRGSSGGTAEDFGYVGEIRRILDKF